MLLATSAFAAFLVLFQGQNGEIRGFFSAQARSIMMGHLYVNESSFQPECYVYEDKCFGYFGITPSLLRIPFLIFWNNLEFTSSSLIVAITIGILVTYLLLHKIALLLNFWNKKVNGKLKIRYLVVLIALGPGSIFVQLTRPSGQWESIAWGSTFSTLGIMSIVSWHESHKRSHLVIALIYFSFAANARITNGLIAFAVATACILFKKKFKFAIDRLSILFLLLIGSIPTLSALLVLYLKFETFFPDLKLHIQVPEAGHWNQILSTNGGKTVGIAFVLSNLLTYLRPDSLAFVDFNELVSLRPTYFPVQHIFPLNEGGMYNEPTASVTNIMPIFIFMLIYVYWPKKQQVREKSNSTKVNDPTLYFLKGISVACFAGLIVTLTFVASSNRYLGDFLPGASMVVIIGWLVMFKNERKEEKESYFILATSLVFLGVFANMLSALTRARYGSL
jgi:hypothetical protein